MKCVLTIEDFLLGVNDSMELDSGQCVASLEVDDLLVCVNVEGYVRVVFENSVYKAPSQFPDELKQLFHDGKAEDDERVFIDNNNWFESFIYYKNPDYNPKEKDSIKWFCDNAWCEVLDGEWENETDVFNTLLELAKEYKKAMEEEK